MFDIGNLKDLLTLKNINKSNDLAKEIELLSKAIIELQEQITKLKEEVKTLKESIAKD